jgi:hypothetical protein
MSKLHTRLARLEKERRAADAKPAIDWTPLTGPPNEWPEPWRSMTVQPPYVDPLEAAIAGLAAARAEPQCRE